MEEIYIEQTSPKTVIKSIIIILFFLGIIIGGYLYFHNTNILRLNNVVVELGEKIPDNLEIYVKNKIKNINDYEINLNSVPVDENGYTDEVGKYSYTVKHDSQEKTGKIEVKDTKAPLVNLKQLTVGVAEEFLLMDFIEECTDISLPCKVDLKDKSDAKLFSKIGTHIVELKISDRYGNVTTQETKVIVSNSSTLLSDKENDFTVVRTDPNYNDYNGTITYKYDKCVSEELLDELDEYEAYLDLVSTDFSELRENIIVEQEIITLYNKYDYIVGFTVRLTYEDGTIEYVE